MIACVFIGDSTAHGAATAYNTTAVNPCVMVARDGASPAAISRSAIPAEQIGTAIVGTGSNAPLSPALPSDLYRTRQRISAQRVIWILPYHRAAAYQVRRVAVAFGDYVLDLAALPSLADRVHPSTYAGIATALRAFVAADQHQREPIQ